MSPDNSIQKDLFVSQMSDDVISDDEAKDVPFGKKVERNQSQWHLKIPKSSAVDIPKEDSLEEDKSYAFYWKLPMRKLEDE